MGKDDWYAPVTDRQPFFNVYWAGGCRIGIPYAAVKACFYNPTTGKLLVDAGLYRVQGEFIEVGRRRNLDVMVTLSSSMTAPSPAPSTTPPTGAPDMDGPPDFDGPPDMDGPAEPVPPLPPPGAAGPETSSPEDFPEMPEPPGLEPPTMELPDDADTNAPDVPDLGEPPDVPVAADDPADALPQSPEAMEAPPDLDGPVEPGAPEIPATDVSAPEVPEFEEPAFDVLPAGPVTAPPLTAPVVLPADLPASARAGTVERPASADPSVAAAAQLLPSKSESQVSAELALDAEMEQSLGSFHALFSKMMIEGVFHRPGIMNLEVLMANPDAEQGGFVPFPTT